MSNFLNDPEAQARYKALFGEGRAADDKPLFSDPAAQAAYEASGFKETPGQTFRNRETYAQTLRRTRAQASAAPFGASSAGEVDTTGRAIMFPEQSASYQRMRARLRQSQ